MFRVRSREKKPEEPENAYKVNIDYAITIPSKLSKLHKAAFQGNVEKIRDFCKKGAKVDDLDKYGR